MNIHLNSASETASAMRFHLRDTMLIETFDMTPSVLAKVLDVVRQLVAKPAAPVDAELESAQESRHGGGLSPTALRRVRAYVEEHISEKYEMDVLAEIANLSTCHFSRAFKQSLGLPPYHYVMKRRVATAAELIGQTNRPLVDIARSVGFCDQSHFTRSFVRIIGETPRDFRRRNR